ncbi:MAG TPA: DUF4142 domain-containing protein [Polyangia bacterium]|jgi:putative membrane protein
MKAYRIPALVGTVLLVGMVAAVGSAQPAGFNTPQQVLSRLDRLHKAGMELGKLAQTNGSSPKVKAFAKQVAQFHRQGEQRVKAVAKKESITLVEPMPINDRDRENMTAQNATMNELRNLKGKEFDHQYLTTVIQGRENALPILKQILPQVEDQKAKAVLSQVITQLEHQLDTAKKLLSTETK